MLLGVLVATKMFLISLIFSSAHLSKRTCDLKQNETQEKAFLLNVLTWANDFIKIGTRFDCYQNS